MNFLGWCKICDFDFRGVHACVITINSADILFQKDDWMILSFIDQQPGRETVIKKESWIENKNKVDPVTTCKRDTAS